MAVPFNKRDDFLFVLNLVNKHGEGFDGTFSDHSLAFLG
jgi:hypothetical protein